VGYTLLFLKLNQIKFYICAIENKSISNIIIGPAYPLRGGIAAHNQLLSHHLNLAGHSSTIFSYSLQYPSIFFPGRTQLVEGNASDLVNELNIMKQVNSINLVNWYATAKKINVEPPSLVILRFWMPFFGAALGTIGRLIDKSSTKIIGLVDNALPHEPRIGDRFLTNYFLKSCAACLVMSKSVGQDIRKMKSDLPVAYSPHPVYNHFKDKIDKLAARKQLGLREDGKYVLFFGMIRKYKGLDLLLDAMAEVVKKNRDIQLIIAGEYYEDELLYQQKIKDLSVMDNVKSINQYIPDEEVHLYFSATDLVAQTYHTATQSGISQIAMHYEKPVLVTDVGGLDEIVLHQKTGYVVKKDPTLIAKNIVDFFEIENYDICFEAAIIKEKQKYSWQAFVDNLIELYYQI